MPADGPPWLTNFSPNDRSMYPGAHTGYRTCTARTASCRAVFIIGSPSPFITNATPAVLPCRDPGRTVAMMSDVRPVSSPSLPIRTIIDVTDVIGRTSGLGASANSGRAITSGSAGAAAGGAVAAAVVGVVVAAATGWHGTGTSIDPTAASVGPGLSSPVPPPAGRGVTAPSVVARTCRSEYAVPAPAPAPSNTCPPNSRSRYFSAASQVPEIRCPLIRSLKWPSCDTSMVHRRSWLFGIGTGSPRTSRTSPEMPIIGLAGLGQPTHRWSPRRSTCGCRTPATRSVNDSTLSVGTRSGNSSAPSLSPRNRPSAAVQFPFSTFHWSSRPSESAGGSGGPAPDVPATHAHSTAMVRRRIPSSPQR